MNFVWSFIIGGLICGIGQILIDLTKMTPARILVTFVVTGVVLGAFGIWDKVIEFASSGATVPIIGFGNALAKGVEQAVKTEGLIGIFTGGISACSGGVCASLIFGFIVALVTKPNSQS